MMIQRFVRWCETAGSRQRAEGFCALATMIRENRLAAEKRPAAEAALRLVLDDPSPKVRLAVAQALAADPGASRALLRGFLFDVEAVALAVAGAPALGEGDLIEAAASGSESLRCRLAERRSLPAAAAMALAAAGSAAVCTRLLSGASAAALPPAAVRLVAERHGDDAGLRALLSARADLAPDIRQTLILEAGQGLRLSPFVVGVLGEERSRRVAFEACEAATTQLAEGLSGADVPRLVEHLRVSGQISAAFLLRTACAGHFDLLAAALSVLSGRSERRVRAILVDGRDAPFGSLMATCGLDPAAGALVRIAVETWKAAATGRIGAGVADLAPFVLERIATAFRRSEAARGAEAAARLLRRLETESAREGRRRERERLLAA